MKLCFASFLALLFSTAPLAFAHEHAPATLRGDSIELSELDHAMAGSIFGHPVYAAFSEANFTATLTVRSHGADHTMQIADANGDYTGEMVESWTEGESTFENRTTVKFDRIERIAGTESIRIHLLIDGKPVSALVTGESFSNGHFQAPTFLMEGIAASTVEFKFTGESCFGYSVNIAMLVGAAYSHLVK